MIVGENTGDNVMVKPREYRIRRKTYIKTAKPVWLIQMLACISPSCYERTPDMENARSKLEDIYDAILSATCSWHLRKSKVTSIVNVCKDDDSISLYTRKGNKMISFNITESE